MNRINQLFQTKKEKILSIYFTAGFPAIQDTETIIRTLAHEGADLIEIGMPFSDPLADGPVIQKSSQIALENGMTLRLLFEQISCIRKHTQIPLILMGYLNPVLQYGMENFLKKCWEIGIDGCILPDLPLKVFKSEYLELFQKYQVSNVFLISPQTSSERIREIDNLSDSFIYVVAASSITGARNKFEDYQLAYFQKIRNMKLKNPSIIGFGISNRETFDIACEYASGAILGSAFVKALQAEGGNLETRIQTFIKPLCE